ncbi:MAG: cupin domain-containing protein [Ignavibacteriaceae bacterium]|nr:cupin domain-containing protein [Ignavibacteriaceae bacterium]
MSVFKLDLSETAHVLQNSGKEFDLFFSHGTLETELYKPDRVDNQVPHERDEIYIIASGSGKFEMEGEITSVKQGDFLFVPAGAVHKFREFTHDFSTWVIFYGPKGGEKGQMKNFLHSCTG